MDNKITIYDELELVIDPYKELKINHQSNNETIKNAYNNLKSNLSPDDRKIIEFAYNMIKTDVLRSRFNILRNRPLQSLDEIKKYSSKPKILNTNEWIDKIKDQL